MLTTSPKSVLAVAIAGLAAACVFGFRGEAEFAGEASLDGVDTVQLELPATELVLAGEASRSFIDWQGKWLSIGGSSNDALTAARAADLVWESHSGVGRLSARVDVSLRDLTSLEHLDVQSATYLAHEIVGVGNVFVTGIDAYISVSLDGGDVEILGGVEQVHVTTTRGDVDVTTSAAVDVQSGAGSVSVQSEIPRDVEIETTGSVEVQLADATNVDIDIADAGKVAVQLPAATHIGSGSYRRLLGAGTYKLHIRSNGGAVRVAALPGSE